MSDQETGAIKEEPTPIPLAEFLEGSPPGNKISVTDLAEPQRLGPNADSFFAAPDIQLHCGCDSCNGTMFFRWTAGRPLLKADRWHFFYVTYRFWVLQDTAVPSHRVQGPRRSIPRRLPRRAGGCWVGWPPQDRPHLAPGGCATTGQGPA